MPRANIGSSSRLKQLQDMAILQQGTKISKLRTQRVDDYRSLIGYDFASLHLPDALESDSGPEATTAQALLERQRQRLSILKSDFAFVTTKDVPELPQEYSLYGEMESEITKAKKTIEEEIKAKVDEVAAQSGLPQFALGSLGIGPKPTGAVRNRFFNLSETQMKIQELRDQLNPDRLDALAFSRVVLPGAEKEGGVTAEFRVQLRDMWRKADASLKNDLAYIRNSALKLKGESEAELEASARLHETSRKRMIDTIEADIRRRQAALLANQGQALRRTTGFGD